MGASADMQGLARLVALDVPPARATWQAFPIPADAHEPRDWLLVAVLDFDAEPWSRVEGVLAEGEPPTRAELPEEAIAPWLEGAIGAGRLPHAARPGHRRVDLPLRPARSFYRSPLLDGFAALAGDRKLLVVLHTS